MSEQMTSRQKLERLTVKYPELKPVLKLLLKDKNRFTDLRNIMSNLEDKTVLIGRDSNDLYLWYQIAYILKYGYLHITKMTTVDLLESYLLEFEDVVRLSQVQDDLVIIRDSRSFMPNKQSGNFVSQVFEQNNKAIYYYVGTYSQFTSTMQDFKNYCEDNNIPILQVNKVQNDDDII